MSVSVFFITAGKHFRRGASQIFVKEASEASSDSERSKVASEAM